MRDECEHEDEEVRFGQLIEPKLPGLGRLPAGASVFLVIAAAVLMILPQSP